MIRMYLKVAWRGLTSRGAYAFINVLGLGVGVAACLLVGVYVRFELGFDAQHQHADRVVRLVSDRLVGESVQSMANAPLPAGPALEELFPEVEVAVRLLKATNGASIRVGDVLEAEELFFFTDEHVFDVFTLPLVSGKAPSALASPNSLVLSSSAAKRYFGEAEAVGKTVTASLLGRTSDFVVSAVAADLPLNSHFTFDFLVRFDSELNGWKGASDRWNTNMLGAWTYFLLTPGSQARDLQEKLDAFVASRVPDGERLGLALSVQPLRSVHLSSGRVAELRPAGNEVYLWIFGLVAGAVFLMASVNYVNLATASAAGRSREIGARKTFGAGRGHLMVQFMLEAMISSLAALGVGIVVATLVMPGFAELSGLPASPEVLGDPVIALGLFGLWLLMGLVSGAYPALVLSGFDQIAALKGAVSEPGRPRWRTGLMVGQFVASVVLLAVLMVVRSQLGFIEARPLGFDRDQLIVVTSETDVGFSSVRTELLTSEAIVEAAATSRVPGGRYLADGRLRAEGAPGIQAMPVLGVSNSFPETMGLRLVAGRGFFPSDQDVVLLNESAVAALGWGDNPLGRTITLLDQSPERQARVVGVVEDIHFESLHSLARPLILLGGLADGSRTILRVARGSEGAAVDHLDFVWSRVSPETSLKFYFLGTSLQESYGQEMRLAGLIRWFTVLALVISGLGVFGLTSLAVRRASSEIAIRKVLGASVPGILGVLASRFVGLAGLAVVIGTPIAFTIARIWLDTFAYRAELGIVPFALAGLMVVLGSFAVTAARSLATALANPVDALRVSS